MEQRKYIINIALLLWFIWLQRNKVVFKGSDFSSSLVCLSFNRFPQEIDVQQAAH